MKTFALLATLASTLTATAANTLAWWTFDDDPLGVTDAIMAQTTVSPRASAAAKALRSATAQAPRAAEMPPRTDVPADTEESASR